MLKQLNYKYAVFFCCILQGQSFSTAAMGTEVTSEHQQSLFPLNVQPVLSFITGASIASPRQSQVIQPMDLCHYGYKADSSDVTRLLWGGFLGAELNHNRPWTFIAGVGYYQPGSYTVTGNLTQGADPASTDLYRYHYKTKSQQILFEGRAVLTTQGKVQPFLMLGIGAAKNKMSQYQNNVPSFYEFTPYFAGHTQTSFTYSVGPGVDFSLNKLFRIGVSYRFSDLGSAKTSSGQIDGLTFNAHLKQTHLYANQLLVQFTVTPWNS